MLVIRVRTPQIYMPHESIGRSVILSRDIFDYTGAFDYVFDELSHSRLRRGWGVANPDLDVRLQEQIWIELI